MLTDLLSRYFKLNRMRSRFDEDTASDDSLQDKRRIQFNHILIKKKRTSMLRLIILFAIVLWAFYYFTNIK